MKRIYSESIKKWAIGGISGGTLIGLIFMYLFVVGAISNVSYSGDSICAGTIEDPCYAFINFTAEEDIFIYPTNYDPWGRDTLFNFDPNVKSWKLERSWGTSWREIPLNKSCTGTWCGLSNSKDERKFSIAFRENKDYKLRITILKNDPNEDIKWGAFSGVDEIDPTFFGEDKYKKYDEETKEVTIRNNQVEDIVKIKLITPLNYQVPRGYNKVAEYEISSLKDLEILMGNIETYNKSTMESINRTIDFKIKEIVLEEVPEYNYICEEIWNEKNNSFEDNCVQNYIGSREEEKIVWVESNKTFFKKDEKLIVGLFTDVEKGDKIEWIINLDVDGKKIKIEEWAVWTEDLNTDLEGYWTMDETSGTVAADSLDVNNGTATNARVMSADAGILGTQADMSAGAGADGVLITGNGMLPNTTFTINTWFNATAGTVGVMLDYGTASSAGNDIYCSTEATDIKCGNVGGGEFYLGDSGVVNNTWQMLTITYNSTGVWAYLNGVYSNYSTGITALTAASQNLYVGRMITYTNGNTHQMDEVGVWSRVLSSSEITDLWNDGDGITYGLPPATLEIVYNGINFTTLNIEAENQINFTINTTGTRVCIDIDHPEYGDNYTCGSPEANFSINISYFRRNDFNDSSTTKNLTLLNGVNQTIYIQGHQYDEIKNVTINITGYKINNTFPTNVRIYINNTLSNFLGLVGGFGVLELNNFNDSSTSKVHNFTTVPQTKTDSFYLPKNSNVTNAFMNISAVNHILNYKGGVYDEIDDSSLNASLWSTSTTDSGATFTPNILEDGESITLDATVDDDVAGGATETLTSNNFPNLSLVGNVTMNVTVLAGSDSYTGGYAWLNVFGKEIIRKTNTGSDNSVWTFARNYSNSSVMFDYYDDGVYVNTTTPSTTNITLYATQTYISSFLYSVGEAEIYYVNYSSTFLTNATLEVGAVDGVYEWNWTGKLEEANTTSNFSLAINSYLIGCTADSEGYCEVPFYITSKSKGAINVSNVNINYTNVLGEVELDKTIIENFLNGSTGEVDIPITINHTQNGTLELSNLKYNYLGGNDTIDIFLFEEGNRTINKTVNLIVYVSSFFKNLPYTWTEHIFFLPRTNSSKNVTAYGQKSTIPLFNITTTNYGGKNLNLSIKVNESFSCMNLSWNATGSSKPTNQKVNTTWQEIKTNLEYLNNTQVWFWADLEQCNASNKRILNPKIYLQSYCEDCVWEE